MSHQASMLPDPWLTIETLSAFWRRPRSVRS